MPVARNEKNESFGVFTRPQTVDRVVTRKDAQRLQFRTTNSFEFSKKELHADQENYFDIHNAGTKLANKYLDCHYSQSELPPREDYGYGLDYRKKVPLDYEANKFLRESFAPTRTGNTILLAREGRPLDVDWSMFKKTSHREAFRNRDAAEMSYTRPMTVAAPEATHRVLGGGDLKTKMVVTKSRLQEAHDHHAIAMPEGQLPNYGMQHPRHMMMKTNYNCGPMTTEYVGAGATAAKNLAADQGMRATWSGGFRSQGARKSSSQPQLRTASRG